MAGDLSQTLKELDPVLTRLERASGRSFTEVEQMDQLQAMVELRASIEQLNGYLSQMQPVLAGVGGGEELLIRYGPPQPQSFRPRS